METDNKFKLENFDDYESTGKVIIDESDAVKTQEEIDKILDSLGDIYIKHLLRKSQSC